MDAVCWLRCTGPATRGGTERRKTPSGREARGCFVAYKERMPVGLAAPQGLQWMLVLLFAVGCWNSLFRFCTLTVATALMLAFATGAMAVMHLQRFGIECLLLFGR